MPRRESPQWLLLSYYPKILVRWWGPMNDILLICECSLSSQYTNRDTWTLTAVTKLIWNVCTHRWWGCSHSFMLSHPHPSHKGTTFHYLIDLFHIKKPPSFRLMHYCNSLKTHQLTQQASYSFIKLLVSLIRSDPRSWTIVYGHYVDRH